MNKGAVALLALAAMACVSTPALAAKKAKPALSVESCKTFLAEQAASGAAAAPAGGMTVDRCKAVVAKDADLQAYRAGFAEAANANDLELFIDMFTGNDPDKLVPKAKVMLKEMRAKEAAEAASFREPPPATAPAEAPAAPAAAPAAP